MAAGRLPFLALCALIGGAFCFDIFNGLPHAPVGAGLAKGCVGAIVRPGVIKTAIAIILSPLVGFVLAVILGRRCLPTDPAHAVRPVTLPSAVGSASPRRDPFRTSRQRRDIAGCRSCAKGRTACVQRIPIAST